MRTQFTMYNYTWRIPLTFISPCQFPFSPPVYPLLLTWNPPSCDRNRPPRSQVACKLTPPLSHPSPKPSPFQIPRTPTAQRLTNTTSGIFRLPLSGTQLANYYKVIHLAAARSEFFSYWKKIRDNESFLVEEWRAASRPWRRGWAPALVFLPAAFM